MGRDEFQGRKSTTWATVHVGGQLSRDVPTSARAATGPEQLIISKVLGPPSQMPKKVRRRITLALSPKTDSVLVENLPGKGLFYKSSAKKFYF